MLKKYALAFLPLLLSGCGLFGLSSTSSRVNSYASPYSSLEDKSLAIVIYAQPATLNEYPGTREEISDFVKDQIREHLPKTGSRILAPQEVINWQTDTLNWTALPEKDIGRHFSVDRVLFIEVLDYSTRKIIGPGEMQGRLRAQCRIVETDTSSTAPADAYPATSSPPAWSGLIDVAWPPDRPLDPTQTNEAAVRSHTLEAFAAKLVSYFYNHSEN